jgi:MFS family permease
MSSLDQNPGSRASQQESAYAWFRLSAALGIGTLTSVGMWSVVVALPAIQADFAVARGDASLPYTMTMVGFGLGGVFIGRLVDSFGIVKPMLLSIGILAAGYIGSAFVPTLLLLSLAQLAIGVGTSGAFAPLMADISHWFTRRRGIAVAICASGNYVGGAVWPPVVQHAIAEYGWRPTHFVIGVFCLIAVPPLLLALRRTAPTEDTSAGSHGPTAAGPLALSPNALQFLICLAGVACCVAMSMPQVHIVAYCADLGYGPARGAEMLSIMLGSGVISRVGSGFIADRIGALPTLLLGSVLQTVALLLYLTFDGLTSLYVISLLFGLFQGGIVPMYAIVVREHFPASETGFRVGLAVMATIAGMALGGWMSGAIFDLTGSYWQAFANGVAWNVINALIILFLLMRRSEPQPALATTRTR